VLFLLQNNVKEFHLTCGGLFVASFEYFATVRSKRRRETKGSEGLKIGRGYVGERKRGREGGGGERERKDE